MGRVVQIVGWVFLLAGVGVVALGLFGVAMSQGVWAAMQMLSPFNIANFIVTAATLAPGILLIAWGKSLSDKAAERT